MKALLFDFGGTLDTDGVHWSEKFWEVYQRAGVQMSKRDFERAYVAAESGMSEDIVLPRDTLRTTLEKQVTLQCDALKQLKHLVAQVSSPGLPARVAGECYDDVRRTIGRIRPVLEACAQQFVLGLVSNFYGNLQTVCGELNIDSFFKVVVDSAIVGARKPDPAIFQIAITKLGIPAGETLVLGDSYDRDIVPAKRLGCRTVWLQGKSWSIPLDTSSADFVIHSLMTVRSFLAPAGTTVPF